jgi:transcriptional regulator with XRE-family HTH domain
MQDPIVSERRLARRPDQSLSTIVRRLRQEKNFSMAELAERSNLAPSTLSKIENGQMSPTYETIISLANGLDVDVSEIFSNKPGSPIGGRRAITRANGGVVLKTPHYEYELLCADIANKKIIPLLTKIHARSVEEFKPLSAHPGEEFVYVIDGQIMLHTELYVAVTLSPGESCYFDSMMGHALVSVSEEPATILWACSTAVGPLSG